VNVVVDTNIWVSYLVGHSLAKLDERITAGQVRVVMSQEQVAELLAVLARPSIRRRFSTQDMEELLYLQARIAHLVRPTQRVTACRDVKDNFILEIALAGDADYIVTGDEDLLVLDPFRGVRIVTYREFERILADRACAALGWS
jgi:putative PIN family toxin of toxin-antitoxin system